MAIENEHDVTEEAESITEIYNSHAEGGEIEYSGPRVRPFPRGNTYCLIFTVKHFVDGNALLAVQERGWKIANIDQATTYEEFDLLLNVVSKEDDNTPE